MSLSAFQRFHARNLLRPLKSHHPPPPPPRISLDVRHTYRYMGLLDLLYTRKRTATRIHFTLTTANTPVPTAEDLGTSRECLEHGQRQSPLLGQSLKRRKRKSQMRGIPHFVHPVTTAPSCLCQSAEPAQKNWGRRGEGGGGGGGFTHIIQRFEGQLKANSEFPMGMRFWNKNTTMRY